MEDISHNDISFVVQGLIDKINTPICLATIRKHFKCSKIILSTWENSNVDGLDYDEVLFNKPPLTFQFSEQFYDNTNKQIVSSLNGLKAVRTPYAVKVRSDLAILSNKFVRYFNKYQKRSEEYKLYKKRILTYIFPSKFKHLDEITPFHIGDWIYFGLTDDLIKMFDIPLIEESNCAFWDGFPKGTPKKFYPNPQKYFPEQYICYAPFLKNFGDVGFKHRFCNGEKVMEISNKFIANNYIVLSHFQMPIYFLKKDRSEYTNLNYEYFKNSINFFEWLRLYKKYCYKSFKYPYILQKIYLKINQIIYKNKKLRSVIEKRIKNNIEYKIKTPKIKVYIVTYKKNNVLNENLSSLWSATKNSNAIDVTVLSNHPDVIIEQKNRRKNLKVIINTTRMIHSWGNLAKDWNFCLLDAFKNYENPDNIDWCILAQNDVLWVKNWDKYLLNNEKYDLITQPCGDQSISLNIEAVKKVGFFDERFTTLHFHEIDYFIRSIISLDERVSINDTHKAHNFTFNPIGQLITHEAKGGCVEDATIHNKINWKESYEFICKKYNIDILTTDVNWILNNKEQILKNREINWYPFFWYPIKSEIKKI